MLAMAKVSIWLHVTPVLVAPKGELDTCMYIMSPSVAMLSHLSSNTGVFGVHTMCVCVCVCVVTLRHRGMYMYMHMCNVLMHPIHVYVGSVHKCTCTCMYSMCVFFVKILFDQLYELHGAIISTTAIWIDYSLVLPKVPVCTAHVPNVPSLS